jgi:hypothetical protein
MRDRFFAVLLTLVVFATGWFAGHWAERHRPFPRPPGRFLSEFDGRQAAANGKAAPINRAELADQIDKLKPEMEAFRARIAEIYADFDRDILPILTPPQREAYERVFRTHRLQTAAADKPGDTTPLSDEQIEMLMQRPFRSLAFFVVIPMTLERMTNELKLDEGQRGKVKDLLRVRREKFIELVDSAPPPSLMLSRLAPLAQRLSEPQKASPTPAP